MLSWVGAVAHANIALVKYWGKRAAANNLPAVGSISVTLEGLATTTHVALDEALAKDELVLNGNASTNGERERVARFLDIVRTLSGSKRYARVRSANAFPTGAGLASSASGFAALALAASRAYGLELDRTQLSGLARRGSGSAARSVFGGFVEWQCGQAEDGHDSVAAQLAPETHWALRVLVAITDPAPKEIGSSAGMSHTARTSPYYSAWLASHPSDLDAARAAIRARELGALGQVMERSCLKMHAVMLAADPALLYWNGATIELMHAVRAARQRGLGAFFTVDAGPQVKVLCETGDAPELMRLLSAVPGVTRVLDSALGPPARLVTDASAAT